MRKIKILLSIFSYKQFFHRNELALKQIVQWKFSKYIKTQKEAETFIKKMKNSSSDAFKKHLVTLLKDEKITEKEIGEEAKELEDQWRP